MTRRIRCPWPLDFEALHTAWRAAATGKRRRIDVAGFEVRLAEGLEHLRCSLAEGRWQPGPYRVFSVVERGKVRRVAAAPFADRIVHHAVVNALAPVWEKRYVGWSCANRLGRGTHAAMQRAVAGARQCRFALSVDVARFFPSVDHEVLKGLVARHVGDGPLLDLVGRIIDSGRLLFSLNEARPWMPPHEGLLALARPRGLPIGNQTSQFLGNVQLHPVDLVVAQQVRPRAAVRYVDDLMLFDNDRGRLEDARLRIEASLAGLRLRAHPHKTRLVSTAEGFTFVGYRVTPNGIRLPRATLSRFHGRLHALQRGFAEGRLSIDEVRASVAGMCGHTKAAQLDGLMNALLDAHPLVRTHNAKAVHDDDDDDDDETDDNINDEEPM